MLLPSKLEITGDENKDTTGRAGGLAIDGGDSMVALLERESSELVDDGGDTLGLGALEGEHGGVLVEAGEAGAVVVEGGVVVLHELLCYHIGIHLR